MQQEISHFWNFCIREHVLKSFACCGQFIIFLALFWTKKSFEKAFFFVWRCN